jgi:hypothetical protein
MSDELTGIEPFRYDRERLFEENNVKEISKLKDMTFMDWMKFNNPLKDDSPSNDDSPSKDDNPLNDDNLDDIKFIDYNGYRITKKKKLCFGERCAVYADDINTCVKWHTSGGKNTKKIKVKNPRKKTTKHKKQRKPKTKKRRNKRVKTIKRVMSKSSPL